MPAPSAATLSPLTAGAGARDSCEHWAGHNDISDIEIKIIIL